MPTQEHTETDRRYVEAKAESARHARLQGTPEYDPRAHRAAIERQRRLEAELGTDDNSVT